MNVRANRRNAWSPAPALNQGYPTRVHGREQKMAPGIFPDATAGGPQRTQMVEEGAIALMIETNTTSPEIVAEPMLTESH